MSLNLGRNDGYTHFTKLAIGGKTLGEATGTLEKNTNGAILSAMLLKPNPSAATSGINYHKLFAVGDVTGTTAYGFGDPTKPTTGAMFGFGRTVIASATLTDTGLDVRAINKLVNTGANTLQGAYIKAKNYSTGTVGGDLIGLFVETVNDGTVSGSTYGLKIGSDGSTITSDIILRNGATINNNAAGTLTITETAIALVGSLSASGVLTLGADAANGALLLGSGAASNATQNTTAVADKKFISIYTESTATSGDSRNTYLRHYLGGAGGSGEALRAFTTVDVANAANAHGAHISCGFASGADITGQATGVRATLHVPNAAFSAGTYSAGISEVYHDGSSSDISGATTHAIHRFISAGDGTGAAKLVNAFSFEGLASGATAATAIMTGTTFGCVGGIAVLLNGVLVRIPYGTIS